MKMESKPDIGPQCQSSAPYKPGDHPAYSQTADGTRARAEQMAESATSAQPSVIPANGRCRTALEQSSPASHAADAVFVMPRMPDFRHQPEARQRLR